jgi:spermidine synthase
MKDLLIYFVVFICGGAVLAIEILGTRIIGPFYGVSIFLWSSLISVTLVGLSVGYVIGGRLSDKIKNYNMLALIIAVSGVFILLIPILRNLVIKIAEQSGLRASVLLSSFILFFPPLALLGMVSPYAIKLRTQSLDNVGKSSGYLYAVSTIGSVLAALLTGFILIPNFGVIKLTLTIGILLIITSVVIFLTKKNLLHNKLLISLIIIPVFLLICFIPSDKMLAGKGIKTIIQSQYAEIRVFEKEEDRYLLIDGGIHSAINIKTKDNILPYVWVTEITKEIFNYSGDMLLIGLGGGSVLKSFYLDNWDTEVVEIDPEVTKIARSYFNLLPGFNNIHHMDGREFLQNTYKSYDLIILDAFGSSSIPFHLITLESFKLAKLHLKKNGLFTINIEALGWDDIIIRSVAATLKQVFKNVIALPISEPPNTLGNVILVASDRPIELSGELDRDYWHPGYRFSSNYEKNHAWDNKFIPGVKDAELLTDDLNPVEIWSERINLEAKKDLHEILGDVSFLW